MASRFTSFEREGWQRAAGAYVDGFLPLTRQAIEPLLEAAGVRAGCRVLDLASGPGETAAAAAARGALVTGTDLSPAMLAIARARHPDIEFREANAESLPFPEASFDRVTMAFLFGHLSDPARALAEVRRVLVAGGRLGLAWWRSYARTRAFGVLNEALQAHADLDVDLPQGPPFDALETRDSCVATLAAAGFAGIEVREAPLVFRTTMDDAWRAFMTAGVRSTAVLQRQTPARLAAIRAAVERGFAPYATAAGLAVPAPAWIVTGRRP